MRYLLVASLVLLAYSCGDKHSDGAAYFGGEIVNPTNPYVVLYKNDKVVDSIVLDSNNRFLLKIDPVSDGLYHFEHTPEMQYVLIEKGDSILFRLNTLDFDESLIFTGNGAEKNNFMIDMFLVNEDEERLVYDYYDLEADQFIFRMDSLKNMKLEQYENLILNFDLSEEAKQITRAGIDYRHYDSKEIYPYLHTKKKIHQKSDSIPEDYYDYRENLNYNDLKLSYFGPYIKYLNTFFNNMSYTECMDECSGSNLPVDKTLHFHLHKLKLIDSLVAVKEIRDNLYRNTAFAYFRKDHKHSNNEKFIEAFNTYSKDNKYAKEVMEVYTSIKKLREGSKLPDVLLVNSSGKEVNIDTLAYKSQQHTVYYFWSLNQKNHMKNINRKVNELRVKYPEYAFVGISINEDHDSWLKAVEKMELNTTYQFRCEDFIQIRNSLVIEGLNKIIVVKNDGTIINAFGDIYEENFYLNNQKDL
ncbi:TlpA family protein disulfide reductase [Ascidiimonas sp. W6]|uniref:TlpA family protein disulfide reductase n=1 Tax=Ascidiimonas meishanensis TaxID=3128903 RepID=UPI0030EDCD6C